MGRLGQGEMGEGTPISRPAQGGREDWPPAVKSKSPNAQLVLHGPFGSALPISLAQERR